MDSVKSHCFVTVMLFVVNCQYSTVEGSKSARDNLDQRIFPENTENKLTADFIPEEKAQELIKQQEEGAQNRKRYKISLDNGEWALSEAWWISSRMERPRNFANELGGKGILGTFSC